MDVEKIMFPDSGKLVEDEHGNLHAQIVDMEIDPFICTFNFDGCVQIDTEDYTHITLHSQHLRQLITLIEKAERKYKQAVENHGKT